MKYIFRGVAVFILLVSSMMSVCRAADIAENPQEPLRIRVGAYENHPKIYTDSV